MLTLRQTMYQSDYQPYTQLRNIPKPRAYQVAAIREKPRSKYRQPQMDLEILQPFKKKVNVPFNLVHDFKRIVQTNPHDPFPEVKLEDTLFEQKLEARRVRTPVYLTPQINLDKIDVDVMYGKDGLCSSIYSSDWKKACEFAVQNSPLKMKGDPTKKQFKVKDLGQKSFQTTRFVPEYSIPPMEVGVDRYLSPWDKQNPVEFIDRTKIFWEKYQEGARCPTCDCPKTFKGLTADESRELEACLQENALRTPFVLHPPGYTGYVPKTAVGIAIRKKRFTKYDPFVTTLMTQQGTVDPTGI